MRACVAVPLIVHFRPFTVVARPDGRPAVQIEQDDKKQLYVSTPSYAVSYLLTLF